MNAFVKVLLYIWQFPQNLLGLVIVNVLQPERSLLFGDGDRMAWLYYSSKMRGGISLGQYIIVNDKYKDYKGDTEKHEYGHYMQSRYLGPLYLFVIGIPSILWAAWWNESRGVSYYKFYTEALADKLGGVER